MKNFNRTKIIATIGPSSIDKAVMQKMVAEGADVMRINSSHGNYDFMKQVIDNVRALNKEKNYNIAILLDLQGPKIRIGEIENGGCIIKDGDFFILTTKNVIGNAEQAFIQYHNFHNDVKKGDVVLVDDGKIKLEVKEILPNGDVNTLVRNGGMLMSKKGVNLPYTQISIPSITEKDTADIKFALDNDVEWIGLSFVRTAAEIREIKNTIANEKKFTRVIAKIEKPEAVRNIDSIISIADCIMVARGDLGVEIDMAQVPIIQKKIIKKCLVASKPVIVATQMMESMITNFRPTRAEVNDVGNAVYDGADALMLSAETSVGKFPVEVVAAMRKIIRAIEHDQDIYYHMNEPDKNSPTFISDSVCYHAGVMAMQAGAKAIAAMTHSGYTAFKISSHRPRAGIFIFTDNNPMLNILNLVWGVRGFYYDKYESTDNTINDIKEILRENKFVDAGDCIIHVASTPLSERSRANTIKINMVN